MSEKTKIEWTDATWNPIRGCSRVSAGCQHCYAERVAARFSEPDLAYHGLAEIGPNGPRWTGELRVIEPALAQPLRWARPRRIFVNSMSDLFHEKLPREVIARIFGIMGYARRHTFQVLTKRAERMREIVNILTEEEIYTAAGLAPNWSPTWPLPNVWLGVSVETDYYAAERLPALLATRAAVRFASLEPLLGDIDLLPFLRPLAPRLDWVIVGGESGPGARPMQPWWARLARDQCLESRTPFFFKQWGEWIKRGRDMVRVGKHVAGRKLDGREWNEFPKP